MIQAIANERLEDVLHIRNVLQKVLARHGVMPLRSGREDDIQPGILLSDIKRPRREQTVPQDGR